ncbi:MAG: NAD(P)-dependent oxidoreductase [Atopobiaceae bacterium]|nr:NAD(P)-dependent oxidoreductase [Atopobiaceae bacterium]
MAQTKVKRVALVGTGIMGAAIGGHILDAGYALVVHNRTKEKAQELISRGAAWADTPAEAATEADVVLTMVGYPADVEDVYLGSKGILAAARKGAYLIDLTTSSPQLARELHDAAEVMDLHAFDCPVTGGEEGARAGTLTLIAGADERYVKPVLPVLESFSSKIFYFGHAGAGQSAKLCNQVSLASCMVGWADALALARQSGIDEDLMLDMVSGGMGGSVALTRLAPRAAAGDFKPGFLVEHLRKDLGLALAEAEDLEVTLPGAETSFMLYDTLCQVGGSRMGTQALELLYEDEGTSSAAGLDWSALPSVADDGHHHHHHH